VQDSDQRRRQLEAGGIQQRGGLVDGEAQRVGPHFVQPAFQPESGNRDRRVRPAGEDQAQARGPAADQPREVSQHLPPGELVHVVEDDPHGGVEGVQGVGELLHDVHPAGQRPHPGHPLQATVPSRRGEGQQRGHHRRPESPWVAAAGVQLDPRRLQAFAVTDPVRQQQRLPRPGRGADHDDLIGGGLIQPS
jgi:hypothetical protein